MQASCGGWSGLWRLCDTPTWSNDAMLSWEERCNALVDAIVLEL